jgi:hypothetical protein
MSGRKNAIPAYQLVNAQSLAASFQSDVITLTTATHIGFNCSTASVTTNTGTFGVQYRVYKDSNDYSDWTDLTLSTTPTLASTNIKFLMDVTVPPGQVRAVYTKGSGTQDGTVTMWVSGDQI